MSNPLTKRQLEVFRAIKAFVALNGVAPTLSELCHTLGTTSVGSMAKHLDTLRNRGYITNGGGARQIKIKDCCPYCGK